MFDEYAVRRKSTDRRENAEAAHTPKSGRVLNP